MNEVVNLDSPIISYLELSIRERQQLQKGMNFRTDGRLSVFLMSSRSNAPYKDQWIPAKQLLIYEGHDATGDTNKKIDQPMVRDTGRPSDNGKFYAEAIAYKEGRRFIPLQIQVYEKLDVGVWFDKGIFNLVDADYVVEGIFQRRVFKFYLHPIDEVRSVTDLQEYKHERMIPTSVKVEVWKRDGGKCRTCGATTGLHYDHILPYAKGGRSDDVVNIQILCARHNLQKSDKIM